MLELLGFWESVKALAPEAFVKCVFVLVAVFGLRVVKVLPAGKPGSNWARVANLLFSTILTGVTTSATPEELIIFTEVAVFSAAIYNILDWLVKQVVVKPA